MNSVQGYVSHRKWIKVAIDAIAVALSFVATLAIRFEFNIPSSYLANLLLVMPAIVFLCLLANYILRIYSGRWKYASFDELLNLVSAVTISTAILFLTVLLIPGARKYIPISVAVAGGILALFVMAFVRLQFRLFGEMKLKRSEHGGKKVLLVGAGEAGEMVARDMLRHPEYGYSPIGFIDDDPDKRKLVVQGVPVLGSRDVIPRVVKNHDIDEIFITIPSATGEKVREVLPFCKETEAEIKILPSIARTMTGDVGVAAVRELKLEDLLGREPVETDTASISTYITDKVVMVTGAGGSIGSELSRQLCRLGPSRLLFLDNDETSLYDLDMDLARQVSRCPADVIVADIRDSDRLETVFKRYSPQVIFHSAAMKHVPMMELHPSEAVKNNVLGTHNLARLAIKHDVEHFILISTDKAVHPVNVMGTTKRVAELLIRCSEGKDSTLFTAVRFGNVLGSRGSVVPVFRKQIEDGGPVLVTHPEVTRYFMTVNEAAQLVIQAGAYTKGNDVFVLDMGEPVRIIDLANEMVRLLGGVRDIEIRVTGLRPGEKLHEKLVFQVEEMLPTPHSKIGKVIHGFELPQDFEANANELIEAAVRDDDDEIRVLLSRLVPGYLPGATEEENAAKEAGGKRSELRVVKEDHAP